MTGAGLIPDGDNAGQPGNTGTALTTRPSAARRLLPVLVPVLVPAIVVVAADQGAKQWALSRLAGHRVIALPGDWVTLQLISNPGAAFSIGSGATWLFTLSAIAAVIIVPWFALRARSRLQAMVLGMLLGGAAANLLDRLFRAPGPGEGRVVDFIDYHGWFIGNVADIAIVAGAFILVLRTMTDRERASE